MPAGSWAHVVDTPPPKPHYATLFDWSMIAAHFALTLGIGLLVTPRLLSVALSIRKYSLLLEN